MVTVMSKEVSPQVIEDAFHRNIHRGIDKHRILLYCVSLAIPNFVAIHALLCTYVYIMCTHEMLTYMYMYVTGSEKRVDLMQNGKF